MIATGALDNGNYQRIRILLGYSGALIRAALSALLSTVGGMTVAGEVARTDDVTAAATLWRPNVIVLDAGLRGTVTLSEVCAQLAACPVLIVLDQAAQRGQGLALVQLLPRVGLISTEATVDRLLDSIRRLVRGEPALDPEFAMLALQSPNPLLTDRECEVLRLAQKGMTTKEIAKGLGLSAGTVRNHLSRILTKLGARTRIEAIRIATEAGWI